MKLIEPFEVTPARLLSSTVPITETEWTAGTYNTGDQRYIGADLYEVVATPSTNDEPVAGSKKDPPTWFRVGTINRFSAFDGIVARASEVASGSMEWRIQAEGVVTGFALFGLVGETVTVRLLRQSDETPLYERTWSLAGRGHPTTWWEWFFAPFDTTTQVVVTDAPTATAPIIELEVDGGSGPARLGEAFFGLVQRLGVTLMDGTGTEVEDFTSRVRDPFGNFAIRARPSTRIVTYSVSLENSRLGFAERTLRGRLAVPTVYVGDEGYPTFTVVGFPRNIQTVVLGPTVAELLFEVEGLI